MEFILKENIENMPDTEKQAYIKKLTEKVMEITDSLPTVKVEDMLKEDLDKWQY